MAFKTLPLPIIVFLLFVFQPCWAPAQTMLSHAEAGFQLTLPRGWVEIPVEKLADRQKIMLRAGSGETEERPIYAYAFQLGDREWFTYPYVLIAVNEEGRIARPRIKHMNARMSERLANSGSAEGPITDSSLLHSSYDPATHLFSAESELTFQTGEQISLLQTICYTNQGFIQFSLFSRRDEFQRHAPVIKEAVSNLQLTQEAMYKPSIMDKLPLLSGLHLKDILPALGTSLTIGVLLAVAGILFIRRKDKNG